MPRLELLSALLLAQLITNVIESLAPRYEKLAPMSFTDSQVALFCVRGIDKDWKPFVRIASKKFADWCQSNVGVTVQARIIQLIFPQGDSLSLSKLWRNGPEWLTTKLECCTLDCNADIPDGNEGR